MTKTLLIEQETIVEYGEHGGNSCWGTYTDVVPCGTSVEGWLNQQFPGGWGYYPGEPRTGWGYYPEEESRNVWGYDKVFVRCDFRIRT